MRSIAAVLLLAASLPAPLMAQRAQLARKGRQPETGRPAALEPIRKLPRRGGGPPLPGGTITTVARPIPMQTAPALAEDRVRSLLGGTVTPLPAAPTVTELARTLPR